MRLATFNVENIYERPKAMNFTKWAVGKPILDDFTRLNKLIQETVYTQQIKSKLIEIMKRNKGLLTTGESKYIILRDIRGDFINTPKNKPAEIAANGRGDWVGSFELAKEPVTEAATQNIARVIDLLDVDVLCVVEADNLPFLEDFNNGTIAKVTGKPFDHVMLLDSNDSSGMEVGVMTRQEYPIDYVRSHKDDTDDEGVIFSYDCAEFQITTKQGNKFLLVVNHFKSKGYGDAKASASKRLRQATRVRAIYDAYINMGYDYLVVVGNLNETPDQPSLSPLINEGSGLTDIMAHPKFVGDGRPGTHGNGTKTSKFDYILMSPKLSAKVVKGGIERRGVWGGKDGKLFPHLETIKTAIDAASDHAALWVELDI